MILAHRIALKPNKSQANGFTRACGVSRFTYNWALAQCIEHYRATGKSLNLNELKRRWNQEKPACVYESPVTRTVSPLPI